MRRFYMIILSLGLLFLPSISLAAPSGSEHQQTQSFCQVLTNWYANTWARTDSRSFQECAERIEMNGDLNNNVQIGSWDNTQVAVVASTTVYYRQSRNDQWLLFGTLPLNNAADVNKDDDGDGDGDGIVGDQDRCPQQAETRNGFADSDGCPDSLQELIETVTTDLDDFWQQAFTAAGLTYQSPAQIVQYDRYNYTQIQSACGSVALNNAMYCQLDRSIYLDEGLLDMAMMKNGDYAAAVIVAHEWAHLVQHQLQRLQDSRFTIFEELEADCLAGVYTKYAEVGSQLLEAGDLEEGAVKIYATGDFAPWFDPQAHGTPSQRLTSFLVGYRQGIAACLRLTGEAEPAAGATASPRQDPGLDPLDTIAQTLRGKHFLLTWRDGGAVYGTYHFVHVHYCRSEHYFLFGQSERNTILDNTERRSWQEEGVWEIIQQRGVPAIRYSATSGEQATIPLSIAPDGTISIEGTSISFQGPAQC